MRPDNIEFLKRVAPRTKRQPAAPGIANQLRTHRGHQLCELVTLVYRIVTIQDGRPTPQHAKKLTRFIRTAASDGCLSVRETDAPLGATAAQIPNRGGA